MRSLGRMQISNSSEGQSGSIYYKMCTLEPRSCKFPRGNSNTWDTEIHTGCQKQKLPVAAFKISIHWYYFMAASQLAYSSNN